MSGRRVDLNCRSNGGEGFVEGGRNTEDRLANHVEAEGMRMPPPVQIKSPPFRRVLSKLLLLKCPLRTQEIMPSSGFAVVCPASGGGGTQGGRSVAEADRSSPPPEVSAPPLTCPAHAANLLGARSRDDWFPVCIPCAAPLAQRSVWLRAPVARASLRQLQLHPAAPSCTLPSRRRRHDHFRRPRLSAFVVLLSN